MRSTVSINSPSNSPTGTPGPTGEATTGQQQDSLKKVVTATAAGNALEWFDFSSYAFFAAYISANFFLQGDNTSGLISTFLVFAVGFIARPLGAVILGAYGDTHGRKATLTLTVSLMAVGTFIIGFAPPIWVIGAGAPILLLVGRLFQGFSAGGEIGGATSYLVEKAPKERRAGLTGWLQASMGIANALSALIGVAITTLFDDETITQWAWRIPFIVGLAIIPVAIYIRMRLKESEEFLQMDADSSVEKRSPIKDLIKQYPKHLLVGALMGILWQVSVYALVIYAPTYYAHPTVGLGFTANEAFWASLVGNICMIFACLVSGRLADKVGTQRILRDSTLILIIVPVPALLMLHAWNSFPMLIIVHVLMCLAVSAYAGVIPSALARLFPPKVRATGTSFSYNIGAVFFAGLTPAFMTWAIQYTAYATGLYVVLAGVIALLTLPVFIKMIREQEGSDLL